MQEHHDDEVENDHPERARSQRDCHANEERGVPGECVSRQHGAENAGEPERMEERERRPRLMHVSYRISCAITWSLAKPVTFETSSTTPTEILFSPGSISSVREYV